MKKKLVFSIGLYFKVFLLSGQSGFTVSNTDNWQANINLLISPNCSNEDNFQYTGHPEAGAYFINGQNVIGLSQGIVLSTGKVNASINNINDPYSIDISTSFGLPGDSLLSDLINAPTTDAARISIEFTSSVLELDTITFKYVFASDDFTLIDAFPCKDVFGIFVSGGSYNQKNIALFSADSLPIVFHHVFDPNNIGNFLTNHPQLVYNRYTLPLTAEFIAEPGITYTIVFAIADEYMPIYDSAIFIERFASNQQSLEGNITLNNEPLEDGFVELFKLMPEPAKAELVATSPIESGFFHISDTPFSDSYILRVNPDNDLYPDAYPMYYGNKILWNQAKRANVACGVYDVNLSNATYGSDPFTIRGTVYSTTSALDFGPPYADFSPAAEVYMYCRDIMGNVSEFQKTGTDGSFQFSRVNISLGNVVIDVPGLPVDELHGFILSIPEETVSNLDYLIGSNKIIKYSPTTVIPTITSTNVNILPNPVSESLYIETTKTGRLAWKLFDLSGKLIVQSSGYEQDTYATSISMKHLTQGVYFLNVDFQGQINSFRIVKTN